MYGDLADFYDGQCIFVTGGTGFLGKVLIEKLLYSFSGISKIYVLMRGQNDGIHQKLEGMLNKPVFSRLRNEKPNTLEKIVPILGDIAVNNLGITEEDERTLIESVSIVFHVAATIKLNERLKIAANINVLGTTRILDLCQRMRNIKAFVHVSTAYCNLNRKIIDEIVYPSPASLEDVKELIKIDPTDDQARKLIGGRVNTYLFTKAIAESIVAQYHDTVPSIIVRPSIITSSKNDPTPGWIDSWVGPAKLTTTIAKGLNRVILGDPDNIIDLIPVDYVSNLMIVGAAKGIRTKEVTVYGSCTSAVNPITLKTILDTGIKEGVQHKINDLPMPFCLYTRFKWLLVLITFLIQVLPALILDSFLWITGSNKRYKKLQMNAIFFREVLEHFTLNSWIISSKNTRTLAESLKPADQELFRFHPADIDWKQYLPVYFYGIRKFLLNK